MAPTPLHRSLLDLARIKIASDHEFMQAKRFQTAPEVGPALFEEYRLFKLRRTLAYVSERSRYYRRRLTDAGLNPEDIQTMADLAAVPLTPPADLAADPYAFLCVSQRMVERVITFTSSGTVGPQKRIFFSQADIESMTDYMAAGMKTVADRSDVVQILLPEGPVLGQCDLLARGVEKMGARPVIAGMFRPPEEQIEMIQQNASTVLFSETHLMYRITKAMESRVDLSALGLKTIFLTTSFASPSMIQYLGRTWNARVSTHYGLTEMGLGLAVDCPECRAYHFNELDVLGEVIDPETGRSLPPGSTGELVFTTLDREAMPLLRYRTRDLAFFGQAAENCGSFLRTIGHVGSRVESLLRLTSGGVLFPTLFHDTIFRLPEVIDYDLSVDHWEGDDRLIFDVEVQAPDDALRGRLIETIKSDWVSLGLTTTPAAVEVRLTPPGAVERGRHFKKMIRDLRPAPEKDTAASEQIGPEQAASPPRGSQ